jgi:hypothetical protein
LEFSQSLTAQGFSPLVSLVHLLDTGATGLIACAIAASCVGATTSSLSKIDTVTFRPGLRLNRLVLTYLLMGMLILVQQRTALQLCVVLMALLLRSRLSLIRLTFYYSYRLFI